MANTQQWHSASQAALPKKKSEPWVTSSRVELTMAYSDEELARRSASMFLQENRNHQEIEESIRRGVDSWIWDTIKGIATLVVGAALTPTAGPVWSPIIAVPIGEAIGRVAETAYKWIRSRFGRR